MHATGLEGERANYLFGSSTVQILQSGGLRVVFLVDLYNRRRCYWYECQRIGKANALFFYLFNASTGRRLEARGGSFGESLQ